MPLKISDKGQRSTVIHLSFSHISAVYEFLKIWILLLAFWILYIKFNTTEQPTNLPALVLHAACLVVRVTMSWALS